MVIYSVAPPEWTIAGLNSRDQHFYEVIDGIQVEVVPTGENTAQISRVISTNPRDFLNPKVQPGNILFYSLKENQL